MLFPHLTCLLSILPLLLLPTTAQQSPSQARSYASWLYAPQPVPEVFYGVRLPALSFCSPELSHKLGVSATRAENLLRAALNSASKFTETPYTYFFSPNVETANSISALYTAALAVLNGTAPGMRIYCADTEERCSWVNPKWRGTGFGPRNIGIPAMATNYGYIREDYFLPGQTAIVICRDQFSHTLYNPTPCTRSGGLYTSEWILINLILQAINNQQLTSSPRTSSSSNNPPKKLKANSINAVDCNNILTADPAKNLGQPQDESNCIADFASWAWDLGFGESPEWTENTCLDQAMILMIWAKQTFSKGVPEEGSIGTWGAG
ncbi:MAG: hypothetical protein M1812_006028 [Candelaria pacifica]|nr:MAG: hypothetical protein M1812_006028 [Candelaria pacifica]